MADEKTTLSIIIATGLKGAQKAIAGLRTISDTTKRGIGRLDAYIEKHKQLELSFSRLFKIVFLYALAFEGLHKVIGLTTGAIGTMVQYNRELENMVVGIATVLNLVSNISLDGRMLKGVEKFNVALSVSKDLVEKIRDASLKAFVPIQTVSDTFQAIVGFGLQAGATLDEIVDLSTKFAVAVQALQLPMRQVVQEARDLLQGGIQPASSTLAVILGINDQLIKQWKQQGTLIENLKKRLEGLEFALSKKFDTIEGKIFAINNYLRQAFGKGGEGFFATIKGILDHILRSLFIIERKGQSIMITPKEATVNLIRDFGDALSNVVKYGYASIVFLIRWKRENQDLVNTIWKVVQVLLVYKVTMFALRNIFIRLYLVAGSVVKTVSVLGSGFSLLNKVSSLLIFRFINFVKIFGAFISVLKLGSFGFAMVIGMVRLLATVLNRDLTGAIKTVSNNWKNLFDWMAKRPFTLVIAIGAIVPSILGVFEWLFDSLRYKYQDFFNWLYDRISSTRKRIEEVAKAGNDPYLITLANLLKKVEDSLSPENVEKPQKTIIDYIVENYKDGIKKVIGLADIMLEKLNELLGGLPETAKVHLLNLKNEFERILKELGLLTQENIRVKGDVEITPKKFFRIENVTKLLDAIKRRLLEMPQIYEKIKKGYVSWETQLRAMKRYRNMLIRVANSGKLTSEQLYEVYKRLADITEEIRQIERERFGTAWDGLLDGLRELKAEMQSVYLFAKKITKDFVTGFEKTIATSLTDFLMWRLRSLKDFLTRLRELVMSTISQIIASLIRMYLVSKALGFLGRWNFGSDVVASSGGSITQYHSGGYVPRDTFAVLQGGEYVVSRKGVEVLDRINEGIIPASSQNQMVIVNMNISTLDPVSFEQYMRRNKNIISGLIAEDINRNGVVIQSIRRSY